MTNYDNLKKLSVDEMAKLIYRIADDICFLRCTEQGGDKYKCPFDEENLPKQCILCMKDWLLKEVE